MQPAPFARLCALAFSLVLAACASGAPTTAGGAGPFIVVDQFGYLPQQEKIAVVRDPVEGFDAAQAFTPGGVYQVIDTTTNAVVFSGAPTVWNGGGVDPSSGDRAWHFDFSSVTAPGSYEVLDVARQVRSARFSIGADVYRPILVQAMRMFYYQRAGIAKDAAHAGAGWADGASFVGPLQDTHARLYSAPRDARTERDLHGGWYDAGDYNKYTAWGADDVVVMLHAYMERPSVWGDDADIPESGNGVADILDEIKWEMDWLTRMQNADGALLSIVGEQSGSPPSSVTGQTLYGPPNTNAALSAAAAFALGAKVYAAADPRFGAYAADLARRAQAAWAWAEANPRVLFRNNDAAAGTEGLGAGQQETDDEGRAVKRLSAAIYLYALTGDARYRAYVDAHFGETKLIATGYAAAFEQYAQRALLYYASLPGATPSVAQAIRAAFVNAFSGAGDGWGARTAQRDPYMAFLPAYTWGSNSVKSSQGEMFFAFALYHLPGHGQAETLNAAAAYVHYINGVNPLGKVYLSNMRAFGAENSVDRFYHSWFAHGSARWDSVSGSTYGPPPGYLVGGANPHYTWERRCPGINPQCGGAPPSPPHGQPPQKAYADFNDNWPINSWEVTEPDVGYQANYILLLSKFVN